MNSRKKYVDICLEFQDCFLDYPFDDPNWAAVRHKSNRKVYAFIFEHNNQLCINLKNDPQWWSFWRSTYSWVLPAYHMNKEHWSTIIAELSDENELRRLISESYNLTLPRRKNEPKT